MIRGPAHFHNTAPLPANSGYTYAFDSTKFCDQPLAIAAARTAPGKSRGMFGRRRVSGFVKPTGQAITLNFLILTDQDGTTNSAWELDTSVGGTGTVAVASGTAQPFSYVANGDFAIEIVAGATAPTALDCVVELTEDVSAGIT